MAKFSLRIPSGQIPDWAERYLKEERKMDLEDELELEKVIGPRIRADGFLTKPDFLKLAYWKSARTKPYCEKNGEAYVEEVTRIALSNKCERIRIEVLTLLDGVSWPTASVILHFGSKYPYPIFDYRASWSLGIDKPKAYDFKFWWAYTELCRSLARKHKVSMRRLDRALWKYSQSKEKEKEPS